MTSQKSPKIPEIFNKLANAGDITAITFSEGRVLIEFFDKTIHLYQLIDEDTIQLQMYRPNQDSGGPDETITSEASYDGPTSLKAVVMLAASLAMDQQTVAIIRRKPA